MADKMDGKSLGLELKQQCTKLIQKLRETHGIPWKKLNKECNVIIDANGFSLTKHKTHNFYIKLLKDGIGGERYSNEEWKELHKMLSIYDNQEYAKHKKDFEETLANTPIHSLGDMAGNFLNKPLKEIFIKLLRIGLNQRSNSQSAKNSRHLISQSKNLFKENVDEFLIALPEYFLHLLPTKVFSKSPISDLVRTSNPKAFHLNENSKEIKSTHKEFTTDIKTLEGAYLGHSLSPLNDKLQLLMEIGKFRRIADSFGLKKIRVIVTSPEWAMLNESTKRLIKQGIKEEKIKELYQKNLEYRIALYKSVGFREETLEKLSKESDSPSNYPAIVVLDKDNLSNLFSDFKYQDIKEQSESYYRFYLYILENCAKYYKNDKFNHLQLKKYLELLEKKDKKALDNTLINLDWLKMSFLEVKSHIQVVSHIISVSKNKKVDSETFEYIFLQRFAQHRFNNYLKCGCFSEYNFDYVFSRLDSLFRETIAYNAYALYFRNYKSLRMTKDEKNIEYDCISYYTPNEAENGDKIKIDEYRKELLLMQNEDIVNQLDRYCGNLSLRDLAIQVSDILSFLLYLDRQNKFRGDEQFRRLLKIAESLPEEFKESISDFVEGNYHEQDAFDFGNWIFDITGYSKIEIPFYIYPFAVYCQILNGDKELDTHFREFARRLFSYTLELSDSVLGMTHEKIEV